jgi:hypothetical protein
MTYETPHRKRVAVGGSEILFKAAIRLGLPINLAEDGRSVLIDFHASPRRTPAEEEACQAFLRPCMARIDGIASDLYEEANALRETAPLSLGTFLEILKGIDRWHGQTMLAECRCKDQPPRPELPEGKTTTKEERNDLEDLSILSERLEAAAVGIERAAHSARVAGVVTGSEALLEVMEASEAEAVEPVLEIWSGVASLMQHVGEEIAGADPPDPNFGQLPTVLRPGRIEIDMTSLPAGSQTGFTDMLDLAAEQLSLEFALLTAVERGQGAQLAGQDNARDRQLSAAADFAQQLAPVLEKQVAARTAFVTAMRADGMNGVLDVPTILRAVLPGFLKGPSEGFVRAIEHYGDGSQDPGSLWSRAGAHLFDGNDLGAGVFPEMLNPPQLALAEVRAADTLRQWASRLR